MSTLGRPLLVSAVLAVALASTFPLAAEGCSCAMPSDLHEWVDQSEAVFVGRMVEKRDLGGQSFESVYVFEVEEWIKGDAGEVIEVQSASDGAGCGFEFFAADQRIGAAINEEGGVLRGGLCSQIDADVALTLKRGMAASKTNIPHVVVGNGWSSTRLTVLDADGGHIVDLSPSDSPSEFDGTQGLAWCPGGDLFVQWTQTQVHVWQASNLTRVAIHDVTGADGYPVIRDTACRDETANSIWVAAQWEVEAELIEIVDGPTSLVSLEGDQFHIGPDFVTAQPDFEGDPILVEVATGERTTLHETPPNELRAVSVAPHPENGTVAVLETRHPEGAPVESTLLVVDAAGAVVTRFDIPWEAYSPTWLDDERISVKAYDFEDWTEALGFVFDVGTGEVTEIPGWDAENVVASGDLLLGIDGSDVVRVDPDGGEIEHLVTLPAFGAGPLLVLEGAEPMEASPSPLPPDPVEGTVPPLVVSGGSDSPDAPARATTVPWVARGALVVFIGVLIWLALAARRAGGAS